MRGVFNAIANQLNLSARYFKWQLMTGLKAAIEKNCHDYGKTTAVVVIDEAQLLKVSNLEELRLFTNFKIDSHSPMALILLAQPDFTNLVRLKSLEAFRQRLVLRAHLNGLTHDEAHAYVKYHLEIAGEPTPSSRTMPSPKSTSRPRDTQTHQTLCYECLYQIYSENKNIVDIPTVETVLLRYEDL